MKFRLRKLALALALSGAMAVTATGCKPAKTAKKSASNVSIAGGRAAHNTNDRYAYDNNRSYRTNNGASYNGIMGWNNANTATNRTASGRRYRTNNNLTSRATGAVNRAANQSTGTAQRGTYGNNRIANPAKTVTRNYNTTGNNLKNNISRNINNNTATDSTPATRSFAGRYHSGPVRRVTAVTSPTAQGQSSSADSRILVPEKVVNNNIGSTGITDAKAKRTAAANIAQTTKDTNNTKKSTKNTAKRAAANVNAVKPADNSAAVKAQADAARNEAAANNMKIFNMAYNAGRRSGLKKAAEAVKPAAETQTKDIKAYVRDVLNNTGDKTPRKAKPFPNSDGSMGTRTRTRNAASGARTNRATRAAARVNAVTSNIKNNNTNAAASNIMNAVTPQDTAQTNSVPASNPVYDTGMYSAPSSYTAPNNTFIRGADNTPAASNTESAPKSTAQNIKARNINTQNAMNKNGAVNNQNIRNAEEINRQRAMRRNRFSSIFRPYVRRRALKTERIAEGTVTNTVKETPANLVAKKDDGVKNENITTPNDTKNGARNSGQRKGYNDYHYRRWQRSMNPLNRRYNMRFHNALPSRMAKNETIAPAADNAKAPVVTATPAAPVVNEAETSATKVIDAPSVDKNRLDGQVIDKNNLMAEPTETSDSASPATEINTETGDNSADTTTDNNDGGTAETESPAASPEPPEVPAATDNPSSESGE